MARQGKRKKKKKPNIIRLRANNINIGIVIFIFIFIYLIIMLCVYFSREHIQVYTVNIGSLTADSDYTGIILRDETVVYTSDSVGTVFYYIPEGHKTGVGDLVYSIDESGQTAEMLAQTGSDENQLSEENLLYLKRMLSNYSAGYDATDFSEIYDIKSTIQSALLEYASMDAMGELNQSLQEMSSYLNLFYAPQSGIVAYYADGFEGMSPEQLTEDSFRKENYQKTYFKAGEMLENGTEVYKTIDSEDWSVIIPISEKDLESLAEANTVDVRFKLNQFETTAGYSTFVSNSGDVFAKLDFQNYMVQFLSERFVDIELLMGQAEGLKIPKSSLAEKEFYIIPKEYLTTGGDTNRDGFNIEVSGENGETVKFISPTVYYTTDEYYYIDTGTVDVGTDFIKPDSNDRYSVGDTEPLVGAYNINKGYAVFRQVNILEENEEYCIVAENTSYGLSEYDRIVLDSSTVSEEDIIYQ